METKPNIESKINETLESAKRLKQVDVPAFFAEKTLSRFHDSRQVKHSFSYTGLLKVAAVLLLFIANIYTFKYIINPKQDAVVNNTATLKDLVNEYQVKDSTEITFENNINNE